MRSGEPGISILVLAVLCLGSARAQKTVSLLVTVVDSHVDPSRPLAHVRLSLTYLRGSAVAIQGIHPTNDEGCVLLRVEENATEVGTVQIGVAPSDVPGLVIYEPAGGILDTLRKPVTLKLLPTGSRALLGPAQIEALLYGYSQNATTLLVQNRQLQDRIRIIEKQRDDLADAQREWGRQNGFDLRTVKAQTDIWADSILGQKDKATNKELKLAALAKGRIDEYIRLSREGEEQARLSLQRESNSLEVVFTTMHANLRDFLEESRSEAQGHYLESHPHLATQVLMRAAERAETLHESYPKDETFREIWIDAALDAAVAKQKEGEVTEPELSAALLKESAGDYQRIIMQLNDNVEDRKLWITSLNDLGNTLLAEGLRARGDEMIKLFVQSANSYHQALDVLVPTDLPRDWAMTEHHLADALQLEGERIDGERSVDMIMQSVECYHNALKVRTETEMPQEWGLSQTNLGTALRKLAERVAGAKSRQLLDQAIEAHLRSLDVRAKTEHPREWARSQSDLGLAYRDLGERSDGLGASRLLTQAADVLSDSLLQTPRDDVPQAWADKQMSLGTVRLAQAERTTDKESADFLAGAVTAFHHALEVDTEAALPQGWGSAEQALGIALRMEGERTGGTRATGLLDQSVDTFHHGLEIFTEDALPQDWADTQIELSKAYLDEGERVSVAKLDQLSLAAAEACQNALRVFSEARLPQGWARAQVCQGDALLKQSQLSAETDGRRLLTAAIEAYRNALDIYTTEDFPYTHGVVIRKLSGIIPQVVHLLPRPVPRCLSRMSVRNPMPLFDEASSFSPLNNMELHPESEHRASLRHFH